MIFKNMTRAERIQKLASNHPPANRHGEATTADNITRHARFPHPNPLPEGEGTNECLREFHVNDIGLTDCTIPDGMSQALARGGRVDA